MCNAVTSIFDAKRPITAATATLAAWLCLASGASPADAGGAPRRDDEARTSTERTEDGGKTRIRHGLELLPRTDTPAEQGLYRHGEYEVPWNRAGWAILCDGMPVLAGEDFEVVERVAALKQTNEQDPQMFETRVREEVVDKSESRRMLLSTTPAAQISQLVFLTNRLGIGRMRREVIITERGVNMRWTYTSFGNIGGHGLVRITLPAEPIERRGLVLVAAGGDPAKLDLADPKAVQSLAEGLTAPQFRIDHGRFQSRWHWSGHPKRFRLARTDAGMALVLPFSFRGGETITVSLRVHDASEPTIQVGDWSAELREQQLHVAYGQDVKVIVGDFARLAGKEGVDLVAAGCPRETVTEQSERSGKLDIQTASRQFGWLRRQIFAGTASVTIRYDGALTAEGTSCRTGLVLGPCWRTDGVLMRYRDGGVEKQATQADAEVSSPLVSIETTVGGRRLSMAFISEGGLPFAWRLVSTPDAPLHVFMTTTSEHRLAGEVVLGLTDAVPDAPSPSERN